MPRCPNGTRKNKKSGNCDCKPGWVTYKKSCIPKLTPNSNEIMRRCPTGSRKDATRKCVCKDSSKIFYKNVCISKENSPKIIPESIENNLLSNNSPVVQPKQFHKKTKTLLREQPQNEKAILNKLVKACPDITECLMVGNYREYILKLFDLFDLKNVLPFLKKIGKNTNNQNANVFELNFEINQSTYTFKSSAILKSAKERYTDNLYYEFLVGRYLNNYHKYLPVFIETYNLYKNDNQTLKDSLFSSLDDIINLDDYTDLHMNQIFIKQKHDKLSLKDACMYSDQFVFTTQNIKKSKTLNEIILGKNKYNLHNYDLASCIYQIYFSLCSLNRVTPFAHYDLHAGNILLFKPFDNDMLHYRYHMLSGEVRDIYTPYMVKIIDYGRCFYKSSPDIYETITKPEFKKVCGRDHGTVNGFFLSKRLRDSIFINYKNINLSHDLRLLSNIRDLNVKKILYSSSDILPLFHKVKYNVGIEQDSNYYRYGTQPNNNPGGSTSINNIWDVPNHFWEYISKIQRTPTNIKATLDIYEDMQTPLKFTVLNDA
jgi:hypothetical protein